MKFSKYFVSLVTQIFFVSFVTQNIFAAHVSDRPIYATDIKNAAGTSVFNFATVLPTANRVCTTNADSEIVSSSVTTTTLGFLDATSSIQSQLDAKVVSVGATSPITSSGGTTPTISTSMATNKLIGRGSAGTGVMQEITLGTNLSLSGTTLNAAGGSPGGATTNVQYNDAGVFGGDANYTWNKTTKTLTLTKSGLAATPTSSTVLANETAATVGVQQVSPALEWLSRGWKTSGTPGSQLVNFRAYSLPVQGVTNPDGIFKIQSSINGASFSDLLDLYSRDPTGNPGGRLDYAGAAKFTFTHSNQDPGTSRALDLNNASGQYSNLAFTFAGTQKAAITVGNTGETLFKQVNNGTGYMFMSGGSITGQTLMTQIYGGGIYVNGGGYFSSHVTAGSADTTPPATLNSYGSTALKYELVTSATKTLDATHTNIYCDPSTSSCGGTPNVTACSTYSGSGQSTCESHLPCTYNAAITTQCSTAGDNTDQGTCEGQNAACSWTTSACSAFNNDSGQCSTAGYPSGGQCSFTAASCSDFTNTASCNAESGNGCSTNTNDCSGLSDGGGDGTACATQSECSYDSGSGVCSGAYFASCSGSYSGSNGACSGSYATGGCGGSWISSAASCVGTVACSPYSSSGSCNGESGCLWQALTNITLPTTNNTLDGTTSRIYNIMHVGETGTVQINANTGQDFLNYTNLNLRKKGDTAEVQLVSDTRSCSTISTESPCNAQSPCSWTAAVVCSALSDESSCNAASGSGCSWDGFACSGAGSAATCGGGNYTAYNRWMPIKYERAPNYVTKTAAYTLTNEDDYVEWTSGTVAATLPSAALTRPFQKFILKNTGAGVITINTTSSQTIDGNASGSLTLTSDQSMVVVSDGANWIRE